MTSGLEADATLARHNASYDTGLTVLDNVAGSGVQRAAHAAAAAAGAGAGAAGAVPRAAGRRECGRVRAFVAAGADHVEPRHRHGPGRHARLRPPPLDARPAPGARSCMHTNLKL